MSFDGSRAEFYRHRAAEVRAVAANCIDASIQDQLERVAKEYEALALSVERGALTH
jgi:hypothetical protein